MCLSAQLPSDVYYIHFEFKRFHSTPLHVLCFQYITDLGKSRDSEFVRLHVVCSRISISQRGNPKNLFPDFCSVSFDRGFHSPANRARLDELLVGV